MRIQCAYSEEEEEVEEEEEEEEEEAEEEDCGGTDGGTTRVRCKPYSPLPVCCAPYHVCNDHNDTRTFLHRYRLV